MRLLLDPFEDMFDGGGFSITSLFGGTEPKKTKSRDLATELMNLVRAQTTVAPEVFDTEAEFQPQYADLGNENTEVSLFGDEDTPGGVEMFSRAIRESDPTTEKLFALLNQTAMDELGQGTDLDPELEHLFTQKARAGQAARGLGYGPADALEETVLLTELGQDLRKDRRGFATAVAGLDQLRFGGVPAAAAGNATGGPRIIDPQSQYASQLFGQNYQGKLNTNISAAQNATQMWGSLFSMI